MQVLTGLGDDASIKLEDYSAAGEFIQFRRDQYTLKTLRVRVYRTTRLSRSVDSLYGQLGDLLPPVTGEFQGQPRSHSRYSKRYGSCYSALD